MGMSIYSKKIGKNLKAQVIYSFFEAPRNEIIKLFSAITYLSVSDSRFLQNSYLYDAHTFVGL